MYTAVGCGGLINSMFPAGVQYDWSLLDETSDGAALGRQLVGHFREHVFPYLEHFSHFDNALKLWARAYEFPRWSRVAAILLRGNRDDAFQEIDTVIKETEVEYRENPKLGLEDRLRDLNTFRSFLTVSTSMKN
jgi:hypothetical protein